MLPVTLFYLWYMHSPFLPALNWNDSECLDFICLSLPASHASTVSHLFLLHSNQLRYNKQWTMLCHWRTYYMAKVISPK